MFKRLTAVLSYLPVMISRMMLSLRKAADPRKQVWSLAEQTEDGGNVQNMSFVRPRSSPEARQDDMPLDEPTEDGGNLQSMRFSRPRSSSEDGIPDGIPLDSYPEV